VKSWRSHLLCLTFLLACLFTALPAFAHEEDEAHPDVDRRITQTSTALATGALLLVVGGGTYIFLVKRGIIKSKSVDRWE
jgi:hypothetical protein